MLESWRENWAKSINAALDKKGITERVDHRSNIDRGIDELPTIHEGPAVREMEKRGIRTELGEWNRYVRSINQSITNLLGFIKSIMDTIAELSAEHREEKRASEAFSKAVLGYIDRE